MQCDGWFAFTFFNITALNILNLNFDGCGSGWPRYNNERIQQYYTENYYNKENYYHANLFIMESQEVSLSSVTVQGPLSGIHCINVFSASLTNVTFSGSKMVITYIDTSMSSNIPVAYTKASNLNLINPENIKPAYGLITTVEAKLFQVIMEVDNVTLDDVHAQMRFEVSWCNNFTLQASNLFLLECTGTISQRITQTMYTKHQYISTVPTGQS